MPSKKKTNSYSASQLNRFLAEVGKEAQTIDDNGDPITNEEAVARLVYKKAMGWTETRVIKDEYGNQTTDEVYHKPENWALQFIFERLEGKAPVAAQDDGKKRQTAAEKVSELARDRINQMTQDKGPPKYRG